MSYITKQQIVEFREQMNIGDQVEVTLEHDKTKGRKKRKTTAIVKDKYNDYFCVEMCLNGSKFKTSYKYVDCLMAKSEIFLERAITQ